MQLVLGHSRGSYGVKPVDTWDQLDLTPATRAYLGVWLASEDLQTQLSAVVNMLTGSEPGTAYRLYLSQKAVYLDQQIEELEKELVYWDRQRHAEARDRWQ